MNLQNKKGMSFLGLLIAVLLVMILMSFVLKNHQQNLQKSQQSAPAQTIQNVRNAVQDFEKAAAQRADFNPGKR